MEIVEPLSAIKKYLIADGFDMIIDLEASHGSWLHDRKTGKEYLDFFSFYAAAPVGMNHPDAVSDQEFLKDLQLSALNKVSNSDFYTMQYERFVETFARVAIPPEFKHAFFVSGGTLAVENALKAAFDWKVRTNFAHGMKEELGSQVLHFKDAFHGRSGYTLSLTNTADPRKYMYFPRFNWPRVTNPRMTFPIEDHLDEVKTLEQQSLEEIHTAFRERKDDIAAILIEPIQGEGGDNHFREEFLQELRKIANEEETMLIFDEVQTGIGMTGKMWAYQHYKDVVPDMIAFGKKMQTCGFISTDRIDSVEKNVFHEKSRINSTWGGNLTDMVRATKFLEIIEKHGLVKNAEENGRYMMNLLQSTADESSGMMTNIRGKGLFIAFDLPNTEVRDKVKKGLYNEGVMVLSCGKQSIRFRPPLNVSKEEIEIGLNRLTSVLNQNKN